MNQLEEKCKIRDTEDVAKIIYFIQGQRPEQLPEIKEWCTWVWEKFPLPIKQQFNRPKFWGLLGHGQFGQVFLVQDKTGLWAMKLNVNQHAFEGVQKFKPEINATLQAAQWGLGPQVKFWGLFYRKHDKIPVYVLTTHYMPCTLATYLQKIKNDTQINTIIQALQKLLKTLHDHQFTHGDFHLENIMMDRGELKLIDFGHSLCGQAHLDLELSKFLTFIRNRYPAWLKHFLPLNNFIQTLDKQAQKVQGVAGEFTNLAISKEFAQQLPCLDQLDQVPHFEEVPPRKYNMGDESKLDLPEFDEVPELKLPIRKKKKPAV